MSPHLTHPSWQMPLTFYQSQRLAAYSHRLIHGFTGKPLSLGGQATDQDTVLSHRSTLCEALGVDFQRLIVPEQVHGDTVRTTSDPDFSATDAVILLEPGIPVLLLFADCTPVLLYDPQRHTGAVIHAGWRGTAQGIAAKTAQRMIRDYGSRPEDLIAVIGPAIGGCCYEVSPDVVEALAATVPGRESAFVTQKTKPHVDVKTVNRLQLEALGIQTLETLSPCTQCEPQALWSHRRGEGGRQGAYLALKP